MSMQNILNKMMIGELKAGSSSQREDLPAGTYNVILKSVTHNVGKNSNRDFLMVTFQVMDGQYAGRTESVFPNLHTVGANGQDYNEMYTVRQLAEVVSISQAIGAGVTFQWLNNATKQIEAQAQGQNMDKVQSSAKVASELYNALEETFGQCIGRSLKMAIVEKPNKRDPQSPYRNYEFAALPQQSMPQPQPQPQQPAPQPQPQPQQQDPFAAPQIDNSDLPF